MIRDCKQIHETVIRDIVDVIDDVKNFDNIDWLRNNTRTGSIAKRASNLTLVFPVVCSNSISMETAMLISKAIESKCVSLLQILFSSIQVSDKSELDEYLGKFHKNLNIRGNLIDLDDFMGLTSKLVGEGAIEVSDKDAYEAVMEDLKNINYYLSTSYNESSINDYLVRRDRLTGKQYVVEARDPRDGIIGQLKNDMSNMSDEIKARGQKISQLNDQLAKARHDADVYRDQAKNAIHAKGAAIKQAQNWKNQAEKNATVSGSNNAISRRSADEDAKRAFSNGLKDKSEYFSKQITNVDKINAMVPTTMIVNFVYKNPNGDSFIAQTGIVGVKAKLYPVDSMDIINRIATKYVDNNWLFNLMRASTREISFFKDLLFAIDRAKLDAFYMAKDSNNARMFKVLERRAANNRMLTLLKKNDASPIASLVISGEEVEYLKKYNNIDLNNPAVARAILNSYNLMDIVIADESLEVARFLFDDGDNMYENLDFASLSRDAKDGSYKKIVNLMSKMNR